MRKSKGALIHRFGVVRASSQSPLSSVSACGENCVRSLAPPSPTKSATLRGPQVGAVASFGRDGGCAPKPLKSSTKEVLSIAIFHCPIQIIQRSKGKSAVAAAAYRSGEKLVNEWDGMTHDYTRKGGVVHTEIMLPSHAPSEFADRSTLWNSVEAIEKSATSQLAREIEVALPVELPRAEQLALVRAFVKDNFVDAGMCADFAIHDKGTGNPHAHILLTIRPIKENGEWGAKCRKVYDLDGQGQRIPDGKGGWKSHRNHFPNRTCGRAESG